MIITTNRVTSRKAAFVMPISFCTSTASAHRGGQWMGAYPEFMGQVSVLTVADRKRTAVLATADQLVPGTTAWSPPT